MLYFTVKAQKEYHAKRDVTDKEPQTTLTSKKTTFKNIIYTIENQWSTFNITTTTKSTTTTKTTTTSVLIRKSTTELRPLVTFKSFTTPAWPNIFITQKTSFFSTTTSTTTTTLPPSMFFYFQKKVLK